MQVGDGGSAAAAAVAAELSTGMAESFGVGSSALESAQPEEFGGMHVEWAAGTGRWAVRSNSAPNLVATLGSSRKVLDQQIMFLALHRNGIFITRLQGWMVFTYAARECTDRCSCL
jgi:hypothetical protein